MVSFVAPQARRASDGARLKVKTLQWAVYRAAGCRASVGQPHDATDSTRR